MKPLLHTLLFFCFFLVHSNSNAQCLSNATFIGAPEFLLEFDAPGPANNLIRIVLHRCPTSGEPVVNVFINASLGPGETMTTVDLSTAVTGIPWNDIDFAVVTDLSIGCGNDITVDILECSTNCDMEFEIVTYVDGTGCPIMLCVEETIAGGTNPISGDVVVTWQSPIFHPGPCITQDSHSIQNFYGQLFEAGIAYNNGICEQKIEFVFDECQTEPTDCDANFFVTAIAEDSDGCPTLVCLQELFNGEVYEIGNSPSTYVPFGFSWQNSNGDEIDTSTCLTEADTFFGETVTLSFTYNDGACEEIIEYQVDCEPDDPCAPANFPFTIVPCPLVGNPMCATCTQICLWNLDDNGNPVEFGSVAWTPDINWISHGGATSNCLNNITIEQGEIFMVEVTYENVTCTLTYEVDCNNLMYPINENMVDHFANPAPVDLTNKNNTATVNIYPNPTGQVIFVQQSEKRSSTVEIYNLTGEMVLTEKINSAGHHTLSVEHLKRGTYILKIRDITGQQYFIEKLTILH